MLSCLIMINSKLHCTIYNTIVNVSLTHLQEVVHSVPLLGEQLVLLDSANSDRHTH